MRSYVYCPECHSGILVSLSISPQSLLGYLPPAICPVLGDFPPSKYSSTTLDGVPSRVSRLPNPPFLFLFSSRHLSSLAVPPASVSRIPHHLVQFSRLSPRVILASKLSGVPDNARGVMGCS